MGKPFNVNTNRFDPYKTFRFLVYFGTGTTPVRLSDVQPEGKRMMPAEAWARGVRDADLVVD